MIVPVRELSIRNFRGIRQAKLTLHPRVTVLFGSNASGKTTVLDAMAIVLGSLVSRVPKAMGRDFAKSGDIRVPWKERPEFGEQKGVECPYSRIEACCESGLRWDVTKLRSMQDRSSVPPAVGTRALYEALDPLVRQGLDTADENPSAPIPLVAAYGNERAVVELPLREQGFRRDFPRFGGLDQSLRATTRFKTVFEWFRVMEDEERRERERRKDFGYMLPELQWVRQAVARAELRCRNPRVETRPIRMLVDFEHEGDETEPLNTNALSDGYRTHFALIVDVARRMVQLNPSPDLADPERGTNSPAIILIDEVDLHLDPAWQGSVVKGLLAAFPNTQFLLTTHSEQVLGSVQAESVRHLGWEQGEIAIRSVPFAQGATGERILVELMDAPERVPGPITEKLERYLRLVEKGQGSSAEASALRQEIETALPNEPALHRAELEMERQALMARLTGSRQ